MKKLTREEELDWCVENLLDWPYDEIPNDFMRGWSWGGLIGSLKLYGNAESITIQDWLDAKEDKKKDVIDWTNTPDGATHHSKTGGLYKIANTATYFFDFSRNWIPSGNTQEWLDKNLIPRPTEQPYIPEIGEPCEYLFGSEPDAFIGSVQAFSGDAIWFKTKDGIFKTFHGKHTFRPIKTEREIERNTIMDIIAKHTIPNAPVDNQLPNIVDAFLEWKQSDAPAS